MDVDDFWKLAEDATLLFSSTAASTAAFTALAIVPKKKGSNSVEISTRLGTLGAMLYMIHITLTNPTPDEEPIISKRILKLLDLLESFYTGKAESNSPEDRQLWYPNLRNISFAKNGQHDLVTALLKFATNKRETVERCFSRLYTFGVKGVNREKREDHQPIEDLRAILEEQASRVVAPGGEDESHIHRAFYEALCYPCTCWSITRQGPVCSHHWTRLKLHDGATTSQDKAIFDVVFSSTPALYAGVVVKWQQLRFEIPKSAKRNSGAEKRVESCPIAPSGRDASHTCLSLTHEEEEYDPSSSQPSKKRMTRFAESVLCPITDQQVASEERCDPLQAKDFCQLLNRPFENMITRLKLEGGALHEIYQLAKSDQKIHSSLSMPLSTMLATQNVCSSEKIVLAYILARNTWQYYNSDFMKVRWTSSSIHFMLEHPLALDDDDDDGTRLDPSKPYLAFQFDGSDDPAAMECCNSRNVLHRYPRILALATLLTELGCHRGKLPRTPAHSLQEQINNDWNNVLKSLNSKEWPRFGFKNPRIADTYRLIVSKCLDHKAFHVSRSTGNKEDNSLVEHRRAIIYKNIVYPLHQLLSNSGFLEENTEPNCQGEVRSGKAKDNRRTPSYRDSRYTHSESESRRDMKQSYSSSSNSVSLAEDIFSKPSVQHQPSCTEYTVGWICALQIENVAACGILDEEYARPELNSANDNNVYEFGLISQHKVVIATLPKGKYGTCSAAVVARDMMRSFPLIKFGLMVGIAGGAPSAKHDIRLGDIVVSSPHQRSGGVVPYDFGKTIQSKEFQPTGSLNAPPLLLLNAVQNLSARHERRGHKIEQTAIGFVQKYPHLKRKYQRPTPETDRLYQAAYLHNDDSRSCEEVCDQGTTKLQIRPPRDKTIIHYGLIASADRLMKNAHIRDALAEKEGILCFEMEAAGLMDHFPCLIIRGICDYSDTHKNDAWQGYAAVAAAAYAKELLERIPPAEIQAH